jgi:hypothetical protein
MPMLVVSKNCAAEYVGKGCNSGSAFCGDLLQPQAIAAKAILTISA